MDGIDKTMLFWGYIVTKMPSSEEKFKLQEKSMYTVSFRSQMKTPLLQFFPHFPSQSN
jgi:hypothetical protein